MFKSKKILKITARIILYALGFILLLLILLNLPPVQNFLSKQVANYLSNELNTEVSVKGVYWKLPKYISIQKIYVEDQQKDTLVYAGEIRADLKLSKIFQQEIGIKSVLLNQIKLNVYPTGNGSNIDFIIENFSADRTQAQPKRVPEDTSSSAWKITFPGTTLLLQNIDAYYADQSQSYDFEIGELSANAENIDLEQQLFRLNELNLANTRAFISLGEQDSTVTDTSSNPLALTLGTHHINFDNVDFGLDMPELSIRTRVGILDADEVDFSMGQSMDINVQKFLLNRSFFSYEVPGTPKIEGFDPNHFSLENINIDVADVTYHDLDVYATINNLAAKEPKGVELKSMQAQVHYNPDTAEVHQLKMATDKSNLLAYHTLVTFPFVTSDAPLGAIRLKSDIERGVFHPRDAIFFAPLLEEFWFIEKNIDRTVRLRANIDGKLNELAIKQLDFKGWDTHLNVDGTLYEPLDLEKTFFDFKANIIEASQEGLQTWIPPNTLPDYIELPASTLARAKIKGFINDLAIDLEATNTSPIEPICSRVVASTQLRNATKTDSLSFTVNIDTLYTSKSGLLNFIPATALPDYIDLPPEIELRGQLNGDLDIIYTDFKLYAIRGGNFSYLNSVGNIKDFFGGGDPKFDISIKEMDLKEEEILAFIPKGILPPYIKIPGINGAEGFVRGKQGDLESTFQIKTEVGNLKAKGFLRDSTYEMEVDLNSFDIKKLFQPGKYEEVVGVPISSFGATLFVSGQGFNPDSNLLASYKLVIKPNDELYKWKEGIVVEGVIDRQSGTMNARVNENGISGKANSIANFNQPNEAFDFSLNLNEFNFTKLNLTPIPFSVRGSLTADSEGSALSDLTGQLRLDNWVINYDTLQQSIDSLVLTADLDTTFNKIAVESDLIYGNLDGKFSFGEIAQQIQLQASSYFDPTVQLEDTLPGLRDAFMNMYFEIDKPELLTMGYIPGLEKLDPCFILGSFNAAEKTLKLYSEVPYLKYSDYELNQLFFFFTSDKDALQYELNFQDIFLFEEYQVQNVNFTGEAESGRLTTRFNQRDSSLTERFNIEARVLKEADQFEIAFDPDLLLNYQDWQLKPSNRILYGANNVNVIDWRLSYDNQYIELISNELNTENLSFEFGQFDLNFVADLIEYDSKIVGGILSGQADLYNIFSKPALKTELTIKDLNLLQATLGDLQAKVNYDTTQLATINASFQGYGNDLTIAGKYRADSLREDFNFDLGINQLDLSNFEPTLTDYLGLLKGNLKGDLKISGETKAPKLQGTLNLQQAAVRPNMLKTRFNLNDVAVQFNKEGFTIPECIIRDSLGQKATFSAQVLTYNYQNFGLVMNFDAKNFMLLNTTEDDNELYYGKMVADVSAEIIGDFEEPVITVDAKSEEGSDLTYVYSVGGIQSIDKGDGVVEFVSLDTVGQEKKEGIIGEIRTGYGLDISVNASINDNLKIKVITDELSGDNFVGQGEGDISLRMLPNNDIELTGRIELLSGDYQFTYSEVIRRQFQVEPGSYVAFVGSPYNPELGLTANYQTKTSPYPLIISTLGGEGNVSETDRAYWKENLQRPETFIAKINVNGPLEDIELSTDIAYPNIRGNSNSQEVRDALSRIRVDESKMNTQAFSLVLFNGFIAEDIGSGGGGFSMADVEAGLSNVITKQLNNLANQYIKFVDLDFGIDNAGNSSGNLFEDSDFRVSLKKSFLDDRLTVNVDGVASTREEASQSGYYLNNISIEYSLSEKGIMKIRLFNKRETEDVFNGDVVKLGGALLFSKDFDRLSLFGNKKNGKE